MIPSDPYTHEAHAIRCGQAARDRVVLVQHVQAKRGPIVYCGVIKNAYSVFGGPDCWTIETTWPEKTRVTIPCRNVIACGGPACSCTPDRCASERAERAAASPIGSEGASNTSETAHR